MAQTMSSAVAKAILRGIGAPTTSQNLAFLEGWSGREGIPQNIDSNNWLGTTLHVGGSYGTNGPGVQHYSSLRDGIAAHVQMLDQNNFSGIRAALKSGNPSRFAGSPEVQKEFRSWSGGGYSFPVDGGGGSAVAPSPAPPRAVAAPRGVAQQLAPTPAAAAPRPNPTAGLLQALAQTQGGDYTSFYQHLGRALQQENRPSEPTPSRVPAVTLPARNGQTVPVRSLPDNGSLQLAAVPLGVAARGGIEVDRTVLPDVLKVAQQFGVRVNSGFRSSAHNAQVGGAPNSDHLRGDAVDFVGSPQQMQQLYQWAQGKFPYVEPWGQAGGNHVHISFVRAQQR